MNASELTAQYLSEAKAAEDALVRVLQSQIAMTPSGSYRSDIEAHLSQTRNHSRRLGQRLGELSGARNPLQVVVGLAEEVVGQTLALGKTPFDLLRGGGGEEKVLKNAKDSAATEALEIATYTAIERLAQSVGDDATEKLAQSIRADEERMLARILREIPKLTDAVVGAELRDDPSYDVTRTGAADAAREAGERISDAAESAKGTTRRTARQARKVPGVARVEGQVKGAVADEEDLAIAGYDKLTAEQVTAKLPRLSQVDLAKIDVYERRHDSRATILGRLETLRGEEPWPGYDELTAVDVESVLSKGDQEQIKRARSYERGHKNRTGLLKAADRMAS